MEPSERRRLVIGLAVAAAVVLLLRAVRSWQGATGTWSTAATVLVVLAWAAWLWWSRRRRDDGDG